MPLPKHVLINDDGTHADNVSTDYPADESGSWRISFPIDPQYHFLFGASYFFDNV